MHQGHRLLGLVVGSLALAGCGGGVTLSVDQQVSQNGQAVGGMLPAADIFDALDTGLGPISMVHALGGVATSDTAAGIRETLNQLAFPREVYCHLRAMLRSPGTTVSLAQITDTRFTNLSYTTIRFQALFDGQHDDGCPNAGQQPVVTPFLVRADLALWDQHGVAIDPTAARAHTRVRNAMVLVQFADTVDAFDPDNAIGAHVGLAFATGLPVNLATEFQDTQFPVLPADAAGLGTVTFLLDFQRLPIDAGTPVTLPQNLPHAAMIAIGVGIGRRQILGALRFDDPNVNAPRVFDTRIEVGKGLTMGVLFQPQATAQVVAQPRVAVGFVSLDPADRGAGFAPNPADLTQLFEAWDASGTLLPVQGYTPPASFSGWPGASTVWVDALGHGIVPDFDGELANLPAPSAWYPTTLR